MQCVPELGEEVEDALPPPSEREVSSQPRKELVADPLASKKLKDMEGDQ